MFLDFKIFGAAAGTIAAADDDFCISVVVPKGTETASCVDQTVTPRSSSSYYAGDIMHGTAAAAAATGDSCIAATGVCN